jgi:hypothetical protein
MPKVKITRVEVWSIKPATQQSDGRVVKHDPVRLNPQPVRSVNGAWGSDEARKECKAKLQLIGYTVRNITFAEGGTLLAYVDPDPTPSRRPRSATTRRR